MEAGARMSVLGGTTVASETESMIKYIFRTRTLNAFSLASKNCESEYGLYSFPGDHYWCCLEVSVETLEFLVTACLYSISSRYSGLDEKD